MFNQNNGALAAIDVNVKIDNKTIAIIGVAVFFAVLLGVIIAKKVE